MVLRNRYDYKAYRMSSACDRQSESTPVTISSWVTETSKPGKGSRVKSMNCFRSYPMRWIFQENIPKLKHGKHRWLIRSPGIETIKPWLLGHSTTVYSTYVLYVLCVYYPASSSCKSVSLPGLTRHILIRKSFGRMQEYLGRREFPQAFSRLTGFSSLN